MFVNKLDLQGAKDAPLDVQDVGRFLGMGEDLGDASTVHSENKVLSLKLFSKCC